MSTAVRDTSLEGHYAGIVTRMVAFLIDVAVVAVVFAVAGSVMEYVLSILFRDPIALSDTPIVPYWALAAWILVYFTYPVAVSGRTLGMAVVGLRVVRTDGHELGGRRAVVRVLALALTFVLLAVGFLLIVLRTDRRGLHDLIAGSAVVYGWEARAGRLSFLSRRGTDLPASRQQPAERTGMESGQANADGGRSSA